MHIRSLKIFCDIVDRRSFSRAAQDNAMSQSSASQAVQALEDRLGVMLLDRTTRPFALTIEGRRFYEGCRNLVKRYDELEEEVRSLHDLQSRRLVVASIYSVGMHHMSAFMQRFTAEHPRAKVQLEYLHPHRVYEEVEKGDANLGLVSYPKSGETIAALPWRHEPMVIVGSLNHPTPRDLAEYVVGAGVGMEERAAPLDRLSGQSFVAFEQGLAIRGEIDRVLAKHGVHVHVEWEFDNIETMKRAIEAGGGVSILPEACVQREVSQGTLWQAAIADAEVVRPLGIVYRRDRQISDLAQQFIAMLQHHAAFSPVEPALSRAGAASTPCIL